MNRTPPAWPLLCAVWLCACPPGDGGGDAPRCEPYAVDTERVDPATVTAWFEQPADGPVALARDDLVHFLERLTGVAIPVVEGGARPAGTVIRLTTAADAAGAAEDDYVLRREADGDVTVWARDASQLPAAVFALLEELGVRFLHPRDTYVPPPDGLHLPRVLDVHRHTPFRVRGIQEHVLHPIETMPTLLVPSADNLADAKAYVDWIARSGQNQLQFTLLRTVDWETFPDHVRAIIAHAHRRGVRVSAVVQMFGASSLQNNEILVPDASGDWRAQMEAGLDRVLAMGWDGLDLAMGEFIATDPHAVVDWMNHAVSYVAQQAPGTELFLQVHVGNYENLYVDYDGDTVFFYHLVQFADPRLGANVHTIFFFDVYRDQGTYGHPDFRFQKDFLFSQLPVRKGRYFPESAYWITADVDVPIFLPEYLHSRWLDIHNLEADARAAGLPPLDGHIMFSSGREWNYWMTDYLAAKVLWRPADAFESFLQEVTRIYGTCAAEVADLLTRFTALHTRVIFDGRLVAYLCGEDAVIDLGYISGYYSHPFRTPFEDVMAMDAAARAEFERTVVTPLAGFAAEAHAMEDALQQTCARMSGSMADWCAELLDGFTIDRLRAEHTVALYRAVLDVAAGGHAYASFQAEAARITGLASAVIASRELHYRYDAQRMVERFENPTIYKFGYLMRTHSACVWTRQEQQVDILLRTGAAAGILDVITCDP
ncbi:MAG: hypothetical protein HY904_02495 [Deltaproteobacteria bacterium]|nr:hypothetical protein [Deltaproteobacteria bacterium]